MGKTTKAARNGAAANLARQIEGKTDILAPNERGESQENGLIKPSDPLAIRLVVPQGGSVTIKRPPPKGLVALRERIRGLTPKQAYAELIRADVESGDFLIIWERLKALCKGGDFRALQEYLDRAVGKSTQTVAVAAELRVSLSDEDRQVLGDVAALFGMGPRQLPAQMPEAKPEVVATVPAKEVA